METRRGVKHIKLICQNLVEKEEKDEMERMGEGGGGEGCTRIIGVEPQAFRYHCVFLRPLELTIPFESVSNEEYIWIFSFLDIS